MYGARTYVYTTVLRMRIMWFFTKGQSGIVIVRILHTCMDINVKLKLRLPPSGLNPRTTAIASSNVDLPLPFSPTMNVTEGCRIRVSSLRTAGSENGN